MKQIKAELATMTDPSKKSGRAVEDAADRHWHLGGGNEVVAHDGREVRQVGLVELLKEVRHHERHEVLLRQDLTMHEYGKKERKKKEEVNLVF